jgi:hypothetical protein
VNEEHRENSNQALRWRDLPATGKQGVSSFHIISRNQTTFAIALGVAKRYLMMAGGICWNISF